MTPYTADAEIIIELSILIAFLLVVALIAGIFIFRDLRRSYRDVYKQQSRFDIELRKTYNLLSKIARDPAFDRFEGVIVKNMSHDEKKDLLGLVESTYGTIDVEDPDNRYAVETYQNMREIRIALDAKVLGYNKKISLFPFNVFARIFRMTELRHYTSHQ
jgi:hypothetical protein